MSQPNSPSPSNTPDIVSLVLHSKKALQHGEQLCSTAHDQTQATTSVGTELLALDAKAQWIARGIYDQLKLAANVAKSIEAQRTRLEEQGKEWDKARVYHSGNLDNILDALERQVVPPDFYQASSPSSIFGSQHSDEEDSEAPAELLVNGKGKANKVATDRSKWKTLRDFVDFGGIVKATEEMEEDRDKLDDILAKTEGFPFALHETLDSLKSQLPELSPIPSVRDVFATQENVTANMAKHLESLASHYDQMAAALRDKETGMVFNEEDLQEMRRDMEELPSVISELESDSGTIQSCFDQLNSAKTFAEARLETFGTILDQLDELEVVMADMLEQHQIVEVEYEEHLSSLQQHLTTLEHLYITYTSYEASYSGLLVELERRRRYRDAAERIVLGMAAELETMRNDEIRLREAFYAEHGPHLPDDLCLCVANLPTKWEVGPAFDEASEDLPLIDEDLLADATKRVEQTKNITESV